MMAGRIRFNVLGPVRATVEQTPVDLGVPQQRATLVALLLRAGAHVTVEQLIDDLWGQHPPRTAVASLRTHVYRLRQALDDVEATVIRSVAGGYSLVTGPDTVDLAAFSGHVERARELQTQGDIAAAEACYGEGLALWTGEALAGVPGPFAEVQRERLGEMRLTGLEEQLACGVELGRGGRLLSELSVLIARHPLRERLREMHMLALYKAGRQGEALAAYTEAPATA